MIDLSNAVTSVLKALSSLSDGDVGMAFLALAAAGTIAMATLQVIKEVTPYRRKVQFKWFTVWQEGRVAEVRKCADDPSLMAVIMATSVCARNTRGELVDLSTGQAQSALFSMPTEDMVAQMKLAIPVVIDEASRYPSTLITLSLGASLEDLVTMLEGQPKAGSPQAYFDARARITRRMERTLDGICIALADRWRLRMQLISLGATTLLVLVVVIDSNAGFGAVLLSVPIGIIGGYFAPITRDLVAALQKLR